jgi:predicted nucleotidyltransferase component of viral defense system
MIADHYLKQMQLLLRLIPSIAKEDCFAMHGGTAINLFLRDMPRLSVDIDLTYLPIETREISLKNISAALKRIRYDLYSTISGIQVSELVEGKELKLFCSWQGSHVKVEVNTVIRGSVSEPMVYPLNEYAQLFFNLFCEIAIVPPEQLFGGKICAALNRQHPRDLFDVKCLIENNASIESYKRGFIFSLLSSDRPIHETLQPNLIDQRHALENQFSGMTKMSFSYNDYEETRNILLRLVNNMLSDADKVFLVQFKEGNPFWESSGYADFEKFPSVQWKLANITNLKQYNSLKHKQELDRLRKTLNI